MLTIIDEEMEAAREEFGTHNHFPQTDYWVHDLGPDCDSYPVVVAQSVERTNLAAQDSVRGLLEDWRPEYVILCGIAGGIQRSSKKIGEREGPSVGDLILGSFVHNAEYNKAENGHLAPRYMALEHPSLPLLTAHCRPLTRLGNDSWVSKELLAARPGGKTPAYYVGEIVAVDSVMGDPGNQHHAELTRRYDKAVAVDMESAGVGSAMYLSPQDVHYNPRWICVRSVSDVVFYPDADAEADSSDDAPHANADPSGGTEVEVDPHVVRTKWREPAAKTAAAFAHAVVRSLLARDRPPSTGDPGASRYTAAAATASVPHSQAAAENPESSDPTQTLKG